MYHQKYGHTRRLAVYKQAALLVALGYTLVTISHKFCGKSSVGKVSARALFSQWQR